MSVVSAGVVLLFAGVVLGESFIHLMEVDPGFATSHVLVAEASPVITDKLERPPAITTR
jgi:hypothetical protein